VNFLEKSIPKVLAVLALALLLAAGCAETPKDPDSNRKPDTFITTYNIDTAPDSATFYYVSVYWRGTDTDGETVAYRYWVGNGDTTETMDPSVRIRMDFPNSTTTYTFYVESKDNSNEWDESAASTVIDMNDVRDVTQYKPNTVGVSVPPDGASTSQGVPFAISGTDVDGVVTEFEWALDDPSTWTTVTPDIITVSSSAVTIVLRPSDLAFGPHIVYMRAIDNMGNVDPSPLTISILVEPGYAPEVSLSVADGQDFIVPYTSPILEDFTVTVTATVDFYYGKVDSFVVSTSEGASFTTTEPDIVLGDLGSGAYWVDVTVWDASDTSVATGQVNFTISELGPDNGILCVNGISWGDYGSDAEDVWTNGVPWGNRTNYKTWDLFDTSPLYSGSDFGDSLLGKGQGVPAWMLDTDFFDAISWFGNNYGGDFASWEDLETDIIAYLEMGGNILLPVRYGADWFFDDLATYCGIVDGAWIVGADPDFLTAKVGTLTDIAAESDQSYWDIPMTNSPDNLWIYEAATAAPGMHAGFITMPNGEAGGGAFCFIAGRSYRWDTDDLKANVDVILNTYFGVQ
jgi:hypothetical protein